MFVACIAFDVHPHTDPTMRGHVHRHPTCTDHREVWEARVGREVAEVRVGDRPVPAEMPLAHEKMFYGGSWADSGFVPGQSVKSRLVGLCCYPAEL